MISGLKYETKIFAYCFKLYSKSNHSFPLWNDMTYTSECVSTLGHWIKFMVAIEGCARFH